MAALSDELDGCEKHYVRCVRPNADKDDASFPARDVIERHFNVSRTTVRVGLPFCVQNVGL